MIRTRFAPSPTGDLHVGGARSALFCWAFARRHEGHFLLRIEDTDQKRSTTSAGEGFQTDLDWLGISWDEGPEYGTCGGGQTGPYAQSDRLDIYTAHLERLLESGAAYRAFETPEELDQARARARAEKRAYRYDRAALELNDETIRRYLDEGRPHVVRFRVPDDEDVVVEDVVLGEVRVSSDELDDFVIRKADGWPTYHLAVVVDDHLMGVSHVIRGQEHLANTPRHVLLQEALGFARPIYAHVSLIFNPDGSKMSKRDKDKALRAVVKDRGLNTPESAWGIDPDEWMAWIGDKKRQLSTEATECVADALGVHLPEINVGDFRVAGYLPEVLVNYLALLGWSPGGDVEQFDAAFLVEHFSLDRIVKSPARFDRDKLLAFNLDAIQRMSDDAWVDALRAFCEGHHPRFTQVMSHDQFSRFALANKARSKTLLAPVETGRFFVVEDDAIEIQRTKPVRKAMCNGDPCGFDRLDAVRSALAGVGEWTAQDIQDALTDWAEVHCEGKLGLVAQPLRVAVSGTTVSPPIHDTLEILGRETVLSRIDRCLAQRDTLMEAMSS